VEWKKRYQILTTKNLSTKNTNNFPVDKRLPLSTDQKLFP
jgi:hypothetical protein